MTVILGIPLAVVVFTFWLLLDHGDDGWDYPTKRPTIKERQAASLLAYRIDPGMPGWEEP